jgi:hypothetical protein
MSDKNTGGQAYPMLGNVGSNSDWQTDSGMTLRDYFAGQALLAEINIILPTSDKEACALAGVCYRIADAMIKEREL